MGVTMEELAAEIADLRIRLNALQPGRAPEASLDDLDRELEYLLSDYRVGLELAAEMLSKRDRTEMEEKLAAAEEAAQIFAANYANQRRRWEERQAALEADLAGTSKFLRPKMFKIKEERVRNNLGFKPSANPQNAAGVRARLAEIRERLAADDRFRVANSAALDAGRKADQRIRATAEKRIRSMLTSQVSPPRWFEAGLGRIDESPDQESWLQLAADVLDFRLRHGVTDELLPLGATQIEEDNDSLRRVLVGKLESLKKTMPADNGTIRRVGHGLSPEGEELFGSRIRRRKENQEGILRRTVHFTE